MGIIEKAAALARELHAGQTRKGKDQPYFEGHLEPVAKMVQEARGSDVQIAAAYLHDGPEDQGGLPTLERIRDEIGPEVADIVEQLSDSLVDTTKDDGDKEPWAIRKRRYLAGLATKPAETLQVSVADKLHNATDILDDYDREGDELWERFNAKHPEYHLWYYESLLEVYRSKISDHVYTERLGRVVGMLRARMMVSTPGIDELVEGVRRSMEVDPGRGDPRAEATWDRSELRVASDDARTARYRRLQSWWRENQLGARPGPSAGKQELVGSSLHPDDVEAQRGLNFLSPEALDHARDRIEQVKAEGGTLEEKRLFHNLLSSMPLCFNLFGTLGSMESAAPVLRGSFGLDVAEVDDIICEWAPQPPVDHLDDRTAFDALVRYRDSAGAAGFVGVETKYTEPFSAKAYENDRYVEVAEASGWFADAGGAVAQLTDPSTNQVLRQVLLAASVESKTDLGRGTAVVACCADDSRARDVVEAVRAELSDPDRLRLVTYEEIVAACLAVGSRTGEFGQRFANRYLAPDTPHHVELGGPRVE